MAAERHEAAGDADRPAGGLPRPDLPPSVADLGGRRIAVEPEGEGLDPSLAQPFQLLPACRQDVVDALGHSVFLSKMMRRPSSVSQGSWCSMRSHCSRKRGARPPVPTTAGDPRSLAMRSTIPSTMAA